MFKKHALEETSGASSLSNSNSAVVSKALQTNQEK